MASRVDYEILREDHDEIVKFSTLHNNKIRLEKHLELLKAQVTNLQDARQELAITFDDPLYRSGDCFLRTSEAELEEQLDRLEEEYKRDYDATSKEFDEVDEQVKALKGRLYSKFGNKINLEP